MAPPAPPRETVGIVTTTTLPVKTVHVEPRLSISSKPVTSNGTPPLNNGSSNGYANGSVNKGHLNGTANGTVKSPTVVSNGAEVTANGSSVISYNSGSYRKLFKSKEEEEEMLADYSGTYVWKNTIGFIIMHLIALISVPLCLTFHTSIFTMLWAMFIGFWSAAGVTMGAHRLYSHKAYKARAPLKMFILALQTVAGQNCLYIWCRDHRLHHKYSDTNADPHNARRGFWYSHVGWLCMKKHPLVISKGKTIDLSDLEADPYVMFQKKWYKPLYVLLAIALPVYVPMLLWNEHFWDSFLCAYLLRYCTVLNLTWTVNSAAHLWGVKPYDSNIMPAENPYVGFWGIGEGWHNYHHAFPWDYRAAEWGVHYSPTTRIIDFFHRIGWAYDMKCASDDMVKRRIQRTGDKSHLDHHHIEQAEPHPDDVTGEEQKRKQQ